MSIFRTYTIRCTLPGVLIAALAGCDGPKPRVYLQPKELPPPPAEDAHAAHAHPEPPREQTREPLPLTFTAPAGWKDAGPDQMNVVRFAIQTAGGGASVNVTPLPLMEGKETFLVNM